MVLFITSKNLATAQALLVSSLIKLNDFLKERGLDVSPLKSKFILFSRRKSSPVSIPLFNLNELNIPLVQQVKFLGIHLDFRLQDRAHIEHIFRGNNIANVISALAGVRWGTHLSSLLALYKALFRSSMEYGCIVYRFQSNKTLFIKLLRIQYCILKKALGYRISTPINTILEEAKEPPLNLRFSLCVRRFLIK